MHCGTLGPVAVGWVSRCDGLIMTCVHSSAGRSPSARICGPPWAGSLQRALVGTHYRPTRVAVLLITLAALSLFDLAATLLYLTHAGLLESNPIARILVAGGGPSAVVLWKLLTVGLSIYIFYIARHRLSGELGAMLCCAALVWLTARWDSYNSEIHTITSEINGGLRTDAYDWVSMRPAAEAPPRRAPARVVLRSQAWDEQP